MFDAGFGKNLSHKRADHAAQNFFLFNRIALNLLKREKSAKRGAKGKRVRAAWDRSLRLFGLFGI